MDRSKPVRHGVSKGGTVGIAGLVLLLGIGLSWAGPPNPTPSDSNYNTAGGSFTLLNNLGSYNTGFGYDVLGSNTGLGNTATAPGPVTSIASAARRSGANGSSGAVSALSAGDFVLRRRGARSAMQTVAANSA
jgi:hypothetical protein